MSSYSFQDFASPAPSRQAAGCKPNNQVAPQSALEQRLLSSQEPITVDETETITANGISGIHANRAETAQWRSREGRSAADYAFLNDPNPQVIRKRGVQKLRHVQEVEVKFLKPPQPPTPPPIQIVREGDTQSEQAPPVVIVQPGRVGADAAPVVLRERPPRPPAAVAPKRIVIPGRKLPAAPRRVVVERLPDLPGRPGKVTVERWLGYERQRRQVTYEKLQDECPPQVGRNVVIEWESPEVEVVREYRCLGVQQADPEDYLRRYNDFADGRALNDLGSCNPAPHSFAVDSPADLTPELFGDLNVLRELNLAEVGLTEYRAQLGQ
jgi:hypothetical protein